jgi:hypothetical protein
MKPVLGRFFINYRTTSEDGNKMEGEDDWKQCEDIYNRELRVHASGMAAPAISASSLRKVADFHSLLSAELESVVPNSNIP